jgi:hypothetical protein
MVKNIILFFHRALRAPREKVFKKLFENEAMRRQNEACSLQGGKGEHLRVHKST